MKRMIRILLTALALFVVTIPIVAFADSYPVKLEYQGEDVLYYPNSDYNPDGFYAEGNKIIETYSDGTTKTYICKSYEWDGEPCHAYFLDGKVTDEEFGEYNAYFNFDIPEGGIPKGTTELTISRVWDYDEEYINVSGKLKVKEHPKPVSLEYKGADLRYYQNKKAYLAEGLETEGNIIIETYSDGSKKTYKCVSYQGEDGEPTNGYFIDGNVTYDEEYGYPTPEYFNIENSDETIPAGTSKLNIYRNCYYGDEEIKVTGAVPAKEYPRPVSLEYKGAEITYKAEHWWLEGFEKDGNEISVKYSDGSSEKYICKTYKADGFTEPAYFLNGKVIYDEDGYLNAVFFDLVRPDNGIKSGTKQLTISGEFWYGDESIKVSGRVNVKELPKPKSATFSGKTLPAYIGQKNLNISDLFKKGNKITVTYTDNSKVTYKYITFKKGKETWSGFYRNGKKNLDSLWGDATVKKGIKKGTNKVTFTMYLQDDTVIKMKNVAFKAKKKYAYTTFASYIYTGKVIKPKIVVRNEKGKVIPAKNYTVTYYNAKGKAVKKPCAKAYGDYQYKVTFKKSYAKNYLNPVWGTYEVIPKTATLSKVTAAKGKFTATWKKVKGIDGYQIEYSTNKSFKYYDIKTIGKSKTSGTVNNLDKGTYYVRARTYKKVKSNGYTWECYSKPSAVKKVTVK